MRKFLINLITSVALAGLCFETQATHIQGMNISYEYLGGDSFKIIADFWRYCGGTAFDNGNCTFASNGGLPSFTLYCPDQGFQQGFNMTQDSTAEATPICSDLNSTLNSCLVGQCGLLGIEWYM